MKAVYQIGLNTFRETIRSHVVYLVLLFTAILILLSVSFGEWSVFARVQVIEDFGLAAMSISGLLLAIFIGVGLLGREISSKTIYHVLAKPVSRSSFITGKFAGLLAVLVLIYIIMAVFFMATLTIMGGHVNCLIVSAIICIWMETAIIVSASVFFSTFASPVLAALFSTAFYIAGHLNDLVSVHVSAKSGIFPGIQKTIYYLIPNLEHLNIRDHVVYNIVLPGGYMEMAVCYGCLYVILFITLGCVIFGKKDL
jgi:ABC-type transport system involved in multi-copper enzyme maturation permease subunit